MIIADYRQSYTIPCMIVTHPLKDWAAVASRRVSRSTFFYMPLIFPRKDLKQVQPQTSSIRCQGDVIYTFPESSGLDDHEGPDTAVRHVYVTRLLSQVICYLRLALPRVVQVARPRGRAPGRCVWLVAIATATGRTPRTYA